MNPEGKNETPKGAPAAARAGGTGNARQEITSRELLGGSREVRIRHADEIYTLRETSKGKLILTK